MELFIKKYTWVIYLFFIALLAFFSAKITSTYIRQALAVEPMMQKKSFSFNAQPQTSRYDKAKYAVIAERNIFDSREVEAAPVESPTIKPGEKLGGAPKEIDLNQDAVKTSLSIKLISTFSVGEGTDERSMATIIASGSKGPDVYYMGSEKRFAAGTEIKKILYDRVEFVNKKTRRLEYVELESIDKTASSSGYSSFGDPKIIKGIDRFSGVRKETATDETQEQKFSLSRSELDAALSNPTALMRQARVRQHPKGIRLSYVKRDSAIAKLGVRRNDILLTMNGKKLSFSSMLTLLPEVKSQNEFSLEIMRRGKRLKFFYEVR